MLYKDLQIDENNALIFIERWSSTELSVGEFTRMLEESLSWHNVPLDILKQVVSFECGYPIAQYPSATVDGNRNPYRVMFSAKSNSSYKGPFQMHPGRGFWAQTVMDRGRKGYKKVTLPASYSNASLGQLLYAMIANQYVRATDRIMNEGNLVLDAPSFYFVHMWSAYTAGPAMTQALKTGSSGFPRKLFSNQSQKAQAFFASAKLQRPGAEVQSSGYF